MQDIRELLFHDKFSKRQKWFKLFQNPLWTPILNAPLPQHRQLAYKQLKLVADSHIVSVFNFVDDPTNIFTAHEMLGIVSGATVTKFTVHYNLFGGSIMALHTQRHKWIFQKLDRLQVTGCFCLTELGYGNNAVEMETTATYLQQSEQFIIDTPSVMAQKYWITNGAIHANQALVFAQTIVNGKNQGINAFLVPIRDAQLKQLQGVQINDMGYKIGLNGIDNAALKFHKVRIPRENMMNRYCDVTKQGKFKTEIKGIQQRFFKVTQRLLSGRLCIASMTLGALKIGIYITLKYSFQRKGVSKNGKSQTPIFDYQLQQNALIPLISRMLGLNMLHNYAKKIFSNPKGHQKDLLMICCVDKTLIGWHTQRSITIMRERCGGQGFLAANMFGQLLMASHAALTAQGDNRVLMVKVVKDILTIFSKQPDYYYNGQFITVVKSEDLSNIMVLQTLMRMRFKHRLTSLIEKMTALKVKGYSNYDILMFNVSDEIQDLALSFGDNIAFEQSVLVLQVLSEGKQFMKQHFILFGWQILLKDMGLFILKGWIKPQLYEQLKNMYNDKVKQASKNIHVILNSLNIPEHVIKIPIACDYEKYNSYANHGELIDAKL